MNNAVRGPTYNSFQGIKQQSQGLAHAPRRQNQNGDDEQRDLDTTSNGDAHRQVEFALPGNDDRRGVLGCIADDRDDDERDPLLGDTGVVGDKSFEGGYQVVCGDVGERRAERQKEESSWRVQFEHLHRVDGGGGRGDGMRRGRSARMVMESNRNWQRIATAFPKGVPGAGGI